MATHIQKYRKLLPKHLIQPNPLVYKSNNYVLLDFEAVGENKASPYLADSEIVCAAWILGSDHPDYQRVVFSKKGNQYEMGELVDAIEKADFIVAHNAKYELGWLERCGIDASKLLPYCTQIGEYVLAGNRKMRFNLNASLARYGLGSKMDIVGKMFKAEYDCYDIPSSILLRYCKKDVWQTHRLFIRQRAKLRKRQQLSTAFTRNIFTPALVEIERNGMHLDKDRVLSVYRAMAAELADLQKQMDAITGGVNFRSGKQMSKLLYKDLGFAIPTNYKGDPLVNKPTADWPDGAPKTDKDTIAKLKATTKKQKEFLDVLTELKKVDSSISKFIGKMADCVNETDDHILYAKMNQTRTGTHRLSSSGLHYKMQFQNFDRRFKPLFSARKKGWKFMEADFAQLEYRTAVFLGDDEVGRQDIANNVDAHSITASIVFDEEWAAIDGDKTTPIGKKLRTNAKSDTFKPLYGGKSGTEKQKAYYEFFMEKHQGIAEVQQEWIDEVYSHKRLKTCTGMRFYWYDSRMNKNGTLIRPDGRPVDQSVCNYPVQSLATAEIVPVGVTYLFYYMKAAKMQGFLVNTVHDSALAEIPEKEIELFRELAVKAMEEEVITYLDKVYDLKFDVPLEAEIEANSHWANSSSWEDEYLKAA